MVECLLSPSPPYHENNEQWIYTLCPWSGPELSWKSLNSIFLFAASETETNQNLGLQKDIHINRFWSKTNEYKQSHDHQQWWLDNTEYNQLNISTMFSYYRLEKHIKQFIKLLL